MVYHTINNYKDQECSVIIPYQNSLTSTDQELNSTSFSTAKVSGLASSPCSSSGTRSCHPRKPTECQCQYSSSRHLPQWHNGCLPKRSQNLRGTRKTPACRSRIPTSPVNYIDWNTNWFMTGFFLSLPMKLSLQSWIVLSSPLTQNNKTFKQKVASFDFQSFHRTTGLGKHMSN